MNVLPRSSRFGHAFALLGAWSSACHLEEDATDDDPTRATRGIATSVPDDDTFACPGSGGPVVVLDGDHGYTRFRSTTAAAGTRFDARGARWSFQTFPTVLQNYPIDIRRASDVCWAGGLVVGTNPLDAGWSETYRVANGAALINGSPTTPGFTVDGIRLHNVWDGIRPSSDRFRITNTWVSYVRDDCVENDELRSGIVDDSLFDGCYTLFSARSASATPPSGPSTAEWTIQNTVARLEPMPHPHAADRFGRDPGHNTLFKWTAIDREDTPSPRLRLIGNVFLVEQLPNATIKEMAVPASVVECRDNVLVWLGERPYPGELRGCFDVTDDRSVYDQARAAWIARHPHVARTP